MFLNKLFTARNSTSEETPKQKWKEVLIINSRTNKMWRANLSLCQETCKYITSALF